MKKTEPIIMPDRSDSEAYLKALENWLKAYKKNLTVYLKDKPLLTETRQETEANLSTVNLILGLWFGDE